MKIAIISRIIVSIVLLFSGFLVGFVSSDYSSAGNGVEYKIIGLNHLSEVSLLEDEFNKLGVEGWELVQFGKYSAIFKR